MTTPTAPPTTAPIQTTQQGPAIEVTGPLRDRYDEILTPAAVAFLTELHHRFASRRHDRLAARMRRRFEIGNGHDPRFREDTAHIREDENWRAGPVPVPKAGRMAAAGRVGPPAAKRALNSGTKGGAAGVRISS